MFHHKFSPYFSNYMLWSQKLKICEISEVKWVKFFPHKFLFPDVILNEGVNKLTRRKHFLWQKFLLREYLCVGNVSVTLRGHLFYFRFTESYWLLTDFKVILHVAIWALLILGAHPFYGNNSSQIRPRRQIWFLFYK